MRQNLVKHLMESSSLQTKKSSFDPICICRLKNYWGEERKWRSNVCRRYLPPSSWTSTSPTNCASEAGCDKYVKTVISLTKKKLTMNCWKLSARRKTIYHVKNALVYFHFWNAKKADLYLLRLCEYSFQGHLLCCLFHTDSFNESRMILWYLRRNMFMHLSLHKLLYLLSMGFLSTSRGWTCQSPKANLV